MEEIIIDEAIKQVAAGTLDFPGYVQMLSTAGIDCYRVDLASHNVIFYSGTKNLLRRFPGEELNIAPKFNENTIRAAIKASQDKEIDYPMFLAKIASGGVETYETSLKDRNIIYRGRRKFFIEPFAPLK
jgi:uncharacterized protein YbcV (DUF1398 family)